MHHVFANQMRDAHDRGMIVSSFFLLRTLLHSVWFGLGEHISYARLKRSGPRRSQRPSSMWGGGDWIRLFGQESRQALRRLARRPSLAVAVVLSLGLGIGASTAVFSLVHGVLLDPLPFPEPERLVGVWHTDPVTPEWGHAHISYLFYREHNRFFDDLGAYRTSLANVIDGDSPEELAATIVSASTLAVLGVTPQLGRGFLEEEEYPGAEPTVVLSHGLWTRGYGADRGVIGRTVRVDGESRTVIGVMPPEFQFPDSETQLWLPMEIDRARPDRSYWNCNVIGRLSPGIDLAQARIGMTALVRRLPEAYPDPESVTSTFEELRLSALVRPYRDDVVGDISLSLWILFGSVGCVLMIACANSTNLFLVSAEERLQEVALRTALGASRAALLLNFLTESAILSLAGGTLGLVLAAVSTPAILALTPHQFPRLDGVGISGPVLLFALGVSLFGSLVLGLIPALHRVRGPASTLQGSGYRVTGGLRRTYVRNGLAVAQLGLALVLMAGSGLMVRTFQKLHSIEPGFESEGVLTFRLRAPKGTYPTNEETVSLYNEIIERVRDVPEVLTAGGISGLPLAAGGDFLGHSFEDFPPGPNDHITNYVTLFVLPGYLEALRIPLVAGRTFDHSDLDGHSMAVMVSAPLAARLWPDQNPIGKRLTPARYEETGTWYEIVGVVGSVRHENIKKPPTEVIYYPLRPLDFSSNTEPLFSEALSIAVRGRVSPSDLTGSVSRAVWSVDPNLPITRIRTMSDILGQAGARTSFSMVLLSVAAGIALALGLMGLYGVISFTVSQRTREIGVRMAMGADQRSVNQLVLGQALRLAGAGLLLGLVSTFALARLLESQLFDVESADPYTLTIVSFLLLATALAASYLPARRAARVDPLDAMAES